METTDGGFIVYPTNRVAGTITDTDEANKAIEDLVAAGFDREDIDVLHGKQDLRRLDPAGAEHGLFARQDDRSARDSVGKTYNISAGADVIRLQEGRATVVGATSDPVVATQVRPHGWLVSWRRNETAIVHAIDIKTGVACTSLMSPNSEPTHVKGTVTLVESIAVEKEQ